MNLAVCNCIKLYMNFHVSIFRVHTGDLAKASFPSQATIKVVLTLPSVDFTSATQASTGRLKRNSLHCKLFLSTDVQDISLII